MTITIPDIGIYTLQQLQQLQQQVQNQIEQVKEKQKLIYGQSLGKIIDFETISKIEEFTAKELGLENPDKYPKNVQPKHLKGRAVVRGVDGLDRPFIAVRIELLNEKLEKICEVVELVFKGLPFDVWVTPPHNLADNGLWFRGSLYSTGTMNEKQIEGLRDLLAGKTTTPTTSNTGAWTSSQNITVSYIRLAKTS